MAVEKSFLNYDKIKQIMLENYGIVINKVNKVNRGSANIYDISSGSNHFVLKEFQEKIDIEKVKIEYSVIKHLKKYNISTPDYIFTKKGNIYCNNSNRIIIIQKFVSGKVADLNTSSKEQIIESVQMYGKIVNALENYPHKLPSFKRHLMSKELCEKEIENIEQLIKKSNNKEINNKLIHKQQILLKIENIDYSWIKKLTYKKSHGDYNVQQFIYDSKGKIKTVLDFVATRNMPISRELIRNYFFMGKEIKKKSIDFNFFIKYIQEFSKYQKLNYYDLKFMPLLYLIELSRTTYGYEQYFYNKSKEYLDFGNELYNQCVCLEKNYKELENKLIKLI